MKKGAMLSCPEGQYDYYVIGPNNRVYGLYSCTIDAYQIRDEEFKEISESTGWYMISENEDTSSLDFHETKPMYRAQSRPASIRSMPSNIRDLVYKNVKGRGV